MHLNTLKYNAFLLCMLPVLHSNIHCRYRCILWLIRQYSILEQLNINVQFDLENIYCSSLSQYTFIYRKESEIYYNHANRLRFYLNETPQNDTLAVIADAIERLDLVDDVHDHNRRFIIETLLRYCTSLKNGINCQDLDFICSTLR